MKGLKVAAIILFIVAGIMLYKGYDKMTNYYYSENYTSLNENAYVGGDAFNYIINGNYSTGFFVLAVGSTISGFICLGTAMIMESINGKQINIDSSAFGKDNKVDNNELPPL